MSGNRQFIKEYLQVCNILLLNYPSCPCPHRVRRILGNGGMCEIFEPPLISPKKIILGLDKYLKGL